VHSRIPLAWGFLTVVIWQRQILSEQWWCFPCFSMPQFPWNACLGQWL
jgi:hypothetical protein